MKPTKKRQLEDVDADSMSGLGLFQQSLSEPALAMAYFNKAVDVSPERSKHLHLAQRAKLHLENKRPDLAIEDLEAAIALQPKWYEGLDQLAAAYEGAGMWVLALQTYQEMVAARPDVIQEVFQRMNNVTQRLVGEVNELQQRKGSAVVKGNAFAAEIASLKTVNERLEGGFEAEKQQRARLERELEAEKQQRAREKQQWERAEQQGARDKEELERHLEEMLLKLEIQEEGNARPRLYTEELDMELLRPRSSTMMTGDLLRTRSRSEMEELLGEATMSFGEAQAENVWREQITEFYRKYNPQKLRDPGFIERTLLSYRGREQELMSDLRAKYTPPDDFGGFMDGPPPTDVFGGFIDGPPPPDALGGFMDEPPPPDTIWACPWAMDGPPPPAQYGQAAVVVGYVEGTSDIAKYAVGQEVSGMGGGHVSGFIHEINPQTPGATTGPGTVTVGLMPPGLDDLGMPTEFIQPMGGW
jgi:hypothetical protein